MTDEEYLDLLDELQKLEYEGIEINLEGDAVTPLDVVHAHLVRENQGYMRDYEESEIGVVKRIKFNAIRD